MVFYVKLLYILYLYIYIIYIPMKTVRFLIPIFLVSKESEKYIITEK
jgi:hypothetical protein